MADRTITVSLDFTANTNQAENALRNLQTSLQSISNMSTIGQDARMTKNIEEASTAAMKLRNNLQAAFDQKTGSLNLSKLNEEMAKSGMSAEKYRTTLSAIGPQGRQAFMELANAVVASETPLRQTAGLVDKLWDSLKRTAGWQLSSSMIHGFMGAVQSAYGYAQNLNQSLNNIRIVTGQSTEQMAQFAEQANKAARSLSSTTLDYTDAALIYYQQGIRDESEIAERTDATIKLANVSRQSAEEVSSQMTAIWNNFADGSHTLEYYADVITKLGATTASSSQEIAGGMEKFAAVAETVGLSYEYAASALATIVATTRQSEDTVGTGLRTIFSRLEGLKLGDTLEDGTDLNKYSQALATIGVNIKDTSGNLKDMDTILDETAAKWDTLDQAQKVAFATTVGGVRQYTNLIALLDNWDMMQENVTNALGSEGTLQEQQEIYAESWEAAGKRVRAAAESIYSDLLKDDFFIDITKLFAGFLETIDQLIDAFGGLGGTLPLILTLMNKIFGEKMQAGAQRIAENIYYAFPKGKQERAAKDAQTKTDFINQTVAMAKVGTGSKEGEAAAIGYTKIASLQMEMVQNAKNLTDAEKQSYQMSIDRLTALTKQTAELGRQADALNRVKDMERLDVVTGADYADAHEGYNIDAIKQTAGMDMSFQRGEQINKVDSGSYEIMARTLEQLAGLEEGTITKTSQLAEEFNKLSNIQKQFTGNFEQDLQIFEQYNTQVGQLQGVIDRLNQSESTIDDNLKPGTEAFKQAQEVIKQFKQEIEGITGEKIAIRPGAIKSVEGLTNAYDKLIVTARAAQESAGKNGKQFGDIIERMYGASKMQEYGKNVRDVAQAEQSAIQAAEGLKTAEEGVAQGAQAAGQAAITTSQKISNILGSLSGFGQAAMNISMLISSAKGLANAFTAPDMSTWERISSIFMSLGMLIPATLSVVNSLKTGYYALAAATSILNAKELANIATKKEDIATTISQTLSSGKLATAKGKEELITKLVTFGLGKETAAKIVDTAATEGLTAAMKLLNIELLSMLKLILPYIAIAAAIGLAIFGIIKCFQKMKEAEQAEENQLKESQKVLQEVTEAYNKAKQAAEDFANTVNNYDSAIDGLKDLEEGTIEYQQQIMKANEEAIKLIEATKYLRDINGEPIKIEYEVDENGLIRFVGNSLQVAQQAMMQQATKAKLAVDKQKEQVVKDQYNVDAKNIRKNIHGTNSISEINVQAFGGGDSNNNVTDISKQVFDNIIETIKDSGSGKGFFEREDALERLAKAGVNIKDEALIQSLKDNIGAIVDLINSTDANTAALEAEKIADTRSYLEASSAAFAGLDDDIKNTATQMALNNEDRYREQAKKDYAEQITDNTIRDQKYKELLSSELGTDVRITEGDNNNTRTVEYKDENGAWQQYGENEGTINVEDIENKIMDAFTLEHMGIDAERIANTIDQTIKDGYGTTAGNTDTGVNIGKAVVTAEAYKDGSFDMTSLLGEYSNSQLEGLRQVALDNSGNAEGLMDALGIKPEMLESLGFDSGEAFQAAFNKGLMEINPEQVTDALGDAGKALGEAMGLDGDYVKELTEIYESENDVLEQTEGNLEATAEAATDAAIRDARLNSAIEELSSNSKDYKDIIASLKDAQTAQDKAAIKASGSYKKFTKVLSDILDTSEDLVDVDFVASLNPEDVEAAAKGDEAAIGRIRDAFIDAQAESAEAAAGIKNELAGLTDGQALDLDTMPFLTSLIEAKIAAGASAEEIQAMLSGFGIDCDLTNLETAMNEAGQIVEAGTNNLVEVGSIDAEANTITVPSKETKEDVGFEETVTATPHPMEVVVPEKEGSEPVKYEANVPSFTKIVTPKPIKEEATKESTATAVKLSNLHKSSGGKVSSSNKTAPKSGGGGGGGGGGGSKKSKEAPKADRGTRYHNITRRQSNVSRQQTENNRRKDRAFGKAQVELAREDLEIQKKKIELQEEYTKEISKNLKDDREEMKKQFADLKLPINFKFDEDGEISNYQEIIDALFEKEKALVNQYNSGGLDDEAFDEAKKKLDEAKEALGNYEETLEKQKDELQTLSEYMEELSDKALELTQIKFELNISIIEDQLEWLDYSLSEIEDDAYSAAKAIALMGEQTSQYLKQGDVARAAISEILGRHGVNSIEELNGLSDSQIETLGFNKDEIDALKDYRSQLYESNQALLEMRRTITDKILDTFDTFNEKVSESYEEFDNYNDILEKYTDIVDLLGTKTDAATKRLVKTLRDTQLQNLRNQSVSAKEIYEGALANYNLAEKQYNDAVARYGANSIEAQQMEEIMKQAADARDDAYSNWLDAYQASLEKAREIYEAEMEELQKDFEKSLTGIYGTFDLFDAAYERAKELKDNYLPEYEKIYELNKLNRDIQKEINNSSSLRDKKALRQLQDEINRKQEAGVQLSKYEVEEMRKKFELEQARMNLEDARNSKSEVRLTRDQNGNWGYVYTASEDKVADAEQKYEDALYQYQKLSDDYITDLDEKIKDLTKNTQERLDEVREALEEGLIDIDQAEQQKQDILNNFYAQQSYLISQFKGATDSLASSLGLMDELYGQQAELVDTLPETTFGQVSSVGSMEEWAAKSSEEILKYAEESAKAYERLQTTNQEIADQNKLNLSDIETATNNVAKSSEKTQQKVSETVQALADSFKSTMGALATWDQTYATTIQNAIGQNELFITSLNNVIAKLATIASYEMKDLYDYIDYLSAKGSKGETITEAEWKKLDEIRQKYAVNYSKESMAPFDTGGYTGEWGDEGKIAILHEKEYVLNADLTARFFDALKTFSLVDQFVNTENQIQQQQLQIETLEALSNYIDQLADRMNTTTINPNDFSASLFNSGNQQLEQNVHIEASFPNVTQSSEIEMAFDNLVNKASQYINRKNMSSMTFQDSYLSPV